MATVRVDVKPDLLRWARNRARLDFAHLERAFPKLGAWERGVERPTLKQLERYARRTYAPVGYFFLEEPPEESLPIPDFRTIRDQAVAQPSPDLLDTIYVCQMRQDWYREYLETVGGDAMAFVGTLEPRGNVVAAAELIRNTLYPGMERRVGRTREETLRELARSIEDLGILVMRNGVVGNNTRRVLDVSEFRGFALSDPFAPVIFVNAQDTRAGQIFTLAHELVHIFVGRTGVTDATPRLLPDLEVERWCNRVAAEFLVPIEDFTQEYRRDVEIVAEMRRLAAKFKVSTLVILRRMHDAGGVNRETMWTAYDAEMERLQRLRPEGEKPGGDFHATEAVRVSRRFARALIQSTLEGNTLYRDAFRLLGIRKEQTFRNFGAELDLAF